MRCVQCAQYIENDSLFCKFCGAKQNTEMLIEYIYCDKALDMRNSMTLPQDFSVYSYTYFLKESAARESFEREYNISRRVQNSIHSREVGEMVYMSVPYGGTIWDEVSKHPYNSFANVLVYYDSVYFHGNHNHYDRKQLSVAKLQPAITINPNINQRVVLFIFSDYVVLTDDPNNHVGYEVVEEIYSDPKLAMNRLRSEYSKYANDPSFRFDVIDKRDTYENDMDEYFSVYYYGVRIYKNGHKIRHLAICPGILRR